MQSAPAVSPELSIVVPTYKESANVPRLVALLEAALGGIAWEVIFVDDDSPDGTSEVAKALAARDPRVRCLRRVGRRGLAGAAHEIPLAPTLHAFCHALVSNWISAGSRLVPLGQTDSQRVLARLEPVVAVTVQRALSATLDDLGSATFRADLASMRHETQYTRLFRS